MKEGFNDIALINYMKSFGFPTSGASGANNNSGKPSSYKADTSKYKADAINVLKKSESLWG